MAERLWLSIDDQIASYQRLLAALDERDDPAGAFGGHDKLRDLRQVFRDEIAHLQAELKRRLRV